MNSTNFPSNGTTSDVGGMISANKRKNTVNDKRMDMLNDTWNESKNICVDESFINSSFFPSVDKFNFLIHENFPTSEESEASWEIISSRNFSVPSALAKAFALIKRCFSRDSLSHINMKISFLRDNFCTSKINEKQYCSATSCLPTVVVISWFSSPPENIIRGQKQEHKVKEIFLISQRKLFDKLRKKASALISRDMKETVGARRRNE